MAAYLPAPSSRIELRIDPQLKKDFLRLHPWHGALSMHLTRAIKEAVQRAEQIQLLQKEIDNLGKPAATKQARKKKAKN